MHDDIGVRYFFSDSYGHALRRYRWLVLFRLTTRATMELALSSGMFSDGAP